MTTLGIFTVKILYRSGDTYWTYGGFGEYLSCIREYFDRVMLFAHVREHEPGDGFYRLPADGLEVVPLPWVQGELQALLSIPRMWLAGRRHIDRVDIVHARVPDYTGVVGYFLAKSAGVPCFFQIVADWGVQAKAVPYLKRAGLGTLLKLHLLLYDLIERQVCSGGLVFAQGETAYAKHRRRADAHLVASSAHRRSDIVAPKPRFLRTPYNILCVARLDGVKNQGLILRALRVLNDDGPAWRVTFVGDGPRLDSLRSEATRLGVDEHVRFAGMVGRGGPLWAQYDAADVFVLPSRSEGTPKVLLEAMARSLPIVATRVGGIPTIVQHRQNGLLVQDDDVGDLVHALREVATSPPLRERLVSGGLSTAARITADGETDRMMRIVNDRWPGLRLRREPCVPERSHALG